MMKRDEGRPEVADSMAFHKRFDEDPSIENYVALRRVCSVDAEIHQLTGVDPTQAQAFGDGLRRNGIAGTLVRGALGGDDRDIDELCLQLLERLFDREELERKGQTHLQSRGKGVPDALIGHLIVAVLEVLQQDNLVPMPSFVMLVREHLAGPAAEIFKSHAKWERQSQALFLGLQMKRRGVRPTIRKIANAMKVQPSTVSRWFPKRDFLKQVEAFGVSFRRVRGGSLDPL